MIKNFIGGGLIVIGLVLCTRNLLSGELVIVLGGLIVLLDSNDEDDMSGGIGEVSWF